MSRGSKINYRNKAYTSVWSATLKYSNSSRKTHGSKQKLILNVDQDIVIVSVANIVYIYTKFGVTRVYLNDGHLAAANVSLLQLYASLDPNMFFRANRQTIVNVEYIARIAYIRSREFRIHLHPPFDDVDIFSNLQNNNLPHLKESFRSISVFSSVMCHRHTPSSKIDLSSKIFS